MHKNNAGRNIPYKYVIRKGDSGEIVWEKLPQTTGEIVNRCLNFPINLASYRKFDDVIWKINASDEKDPGKHARGRNLSMVAMAPTIDDLMESNGQDNIIGLALKAGNVRESLGITSNIGPEGSTKEFK